MRKLLAKDLERNEYSIIRELSNSTLVLSALKFSQAGGSQSLYSPKITSEYYITLIEVVHADKEWGKWSSLSYMSESPGDFTLTKSSCQF